MFLNEASLFSFLLCEFYFLQYLHSVRIFKIEVLKNQSGAKIKKEISNKKLYL